MPDNTLESIRIYAAPEQLEKVRATVRAVAQHLELSGTLTEEVVTAVNEACMNIIQHGYKNNPEGEIILDILTNNDELIFRITDNAPRIDPNQLVSRPLDEVRPGGLGLHFIRSLMDSAEYHPVQNARGNVLELRKKF